ncbi:Cadherin-23 [Xenoophorus captivus]|uniref:Cadherin-23 n=1 Tax=Xenoophorus captivus TaxID=1517983 RepID=A0ABV0RIT7_9TELE
MKTPVSTAKWSTASLAEITRVLVGVYVLDINDNDPVILNLPYNTSVSEGAEIHTSLARVQARDADSGRNALLTYNITAGNLGGAFYINDTVREIKSQVQAENFDFSLIKD